MEIGIAGVGRMGTAIAERLMEIGHTVTVWNRSKDKVAPLAQAGARVAAHPADLAAAVEAIITILTDAAAIEAVYEGPSGLLSGALNGKLVIEMSTVRPQTERALAAKVSARGAAFVECPVGGTTGPARQGKLLGLMGGAPADTARARPILEALCRRLEHVGPIGAGTTMKLAINLPLLVSWQAFGEAFALSREVGLDPARLLDLFADSSGGTNSLKIRGPQLAHMLATGEASPSTFAIDTCRKDLRTMLEEGEARGIDLPVTTRALDSYDEASRHHWGERDAGAMSVYWARRHDSPNRAADARDGRSPLALTLAQASRIVDGALEKGRELECAPLTVAVLDAGGHLLAFKREDRSGIMRHDIAVGKAWGALGMGFGSRELFERATKQPMFITALTAASGGRLIPAPGGVLIKDGAGEIVGGVGVSGDTSDRDELCGVAGIKAAGLAPMTGAS
jgi:3-hydroxyisobutyrate dehydrogenase